MYNITGYYTFIGDFSKFYLLQPVNDLLGLLQVLVIVFGKEPPVYSKSQLSQPLFQNPEGKQIGYMYVHCNNLNTLQHKKYF